MSKYHKLWRVVLKGYEGTGAWGGGGRQFGTGLRDSAGLLASSQARRSASQAPPPERPLFLKFKIPKRQNGTARGVVRLLRRLEVLKALQTNGFPNASVEDIQVPKTALVHRARGACCTACGVVQRLVSV